MTNPIGNNNGNNPTVVNADNTMGSNIIIQFNPASQLPIKLSGGHNFATWKAQFFMLMYGYNLFDHLDGTTPAPNRTIALGTNISPNPAFLPWFRQDKLIQNALMASVEPIIASTVAIPDSAKSAWDALHTTYANKSQTRVFSLRDQLSCVTKDSRSITEYLHKIRSLSDELATAGGLVSNPELIVKILSGLGPEFREISAAIHARDTTISYEEFFEKLLDYELFLRHEDAKKLSSPITAAVATPTKNNTNNRRQTTNSQQWIGHTANVCRSKSHNHFEAKANYAAGFTAATYPWIVDLGATYHITIKPHNLQPYHGNEDVSMGDGFENAETAGAQSNKKWTV
ncbi:hypothetical protein KY290_010459 [Solanum tuberosum]|uniref:Retrotransposon Copia-like N-terminal domain-containing protein n=1 Tax=Solanum tuberosum TaxID=4113 RepID=A0ABQ7VXU6_SOLTU|nr:hypothetical protein KY284_010349 [Solanum tuberosum]KAH0773322.1 hypothetical protein KY290_010459 [Solanum tuberosum]